MTPIRRWSRRAAAAARPAIALLLTAIVAVVGCGRAEAPRYTVTGRVTYKGEPLTAGAVKLSCGDQLVRAIIRPDGTFSAPGVPPGTARVMVDEPPAFLAKLTDKKSRSANKIEKHIPAEAPPPKVVPIPKKYKSFDTSKIVVEVKGDTADVVIALVD